MRNLLSSRRLKDAPFFSRLEFSYRRINDPPSFDSWMCCLHPHSSNCISLAGDFTAVEVSGKVIHADQSEDVLEKDGNTSVQANDQIQLDETGQGLLQFQDRLKVRMFRSTELHVTEVDEQPSGSTFVSLFQSYGNLHLQLNEDKMVRVVLKTDYATLTTLVDGTDFVVCHTPEKITCGVVNEGAVEFQAQGERVIATKGEAIYVRPEEPPSHAICARHDDVRDWLNKIQGTGEFIGLGAIVQGWSQEPCGSAQAAPTLEGAPLPNREGMVKVEAGLYEIGRPQADDFHIASQEIMLAEFWIDLYEVTNAQYQAFMDGTSHSPPAVWPGIQDHPVKGGNLGSGCQLLCLGKQALTYRGRMGSCCPRTWPESAAVSMGQ
jgi:hypothetical protein